MVTYEWINKSVIMKNIAIQNNIYANTSHLWSKQLYLCVFHQNFCFQRPAVTWYHDDIPDPFISIYLYVEVKLLPLHHWNNQHFQRKQSQCEYKEWTLNLKFLEHMVIGIFTVSIKVKINPYSSFNLAHFSFRLVHQKSTSWSEVLWEFP
jgi:hypothetical protein